MKKRLTHPPSLIVVLLSISWAMAPAATDEATDQFSKVIPYELGDAEFAPGDNITIRAVRGTKDSIQPGGTYAVEGTYTLNSKEEASLALFATTRNSSPSPIDAKQSVRIKKGTGAFRLIKTMTTDGYLHVSFYPLPAGRGFGGVYFGQGEWVLRHKGFSYMDKPGTRSRCPALIE
ncbi:MAG: hypothetical protein NTW03_06830 [Verrucomicrobia bacterium]|nr:hypothetical protein [Verrucomicrobiota bacterium]